MYKFICECGNCILFRTYRIHLEGSLTFRKYSGKCEKCSKIIDVIDLNEKDLEEQEYSC